VTGQPSGHETASETDTTLLSRIRKLMDKAAATSNAHEAEAFSRKAAELIARHRIDPERLRTSQDELSVREIPLGRGAYVRARLALLSAVVDAHDARVLFGATPAGTVAYVAGFGADLDVIELMYHSLHGQAAAQMARHRRATPAATQRYRRSFLFGFAHRMSDILARSARDAEATTSTASGGSVALALIERRRRVDAFVDEEFGRVRAARAPRGAEVSAWSAGVSAADRADVGRARLAGRRAIGRGR
jgi:hypothetical protein